MESDAVLVYSALSNSSLSYECRKELVINDAISDATSHNHIQNLEHI